MTGMNYQKLAQARRAWSQGRIELSDENKHQNTKPKKKRKKRKPEGPIGLLAAEIAERGAPPVPEKFRGGRMRSKSSPGRVLTDEEKAELAQKYIAMPDQTD